MASRRSLSMQTRKAASVFPLPVGADIRVALPSRMLGQPCSCGSVGAPNLRTDHSAATECAQAREVGTSTASASRGMPYSNAKLFDICSPTDDAMGRGRKLLNQSVLRHDAYLTTYCLPRHRLLLMLCCLR